MKAVKGNAVVIMDKEDYDEQMTTKINGEPYKHLRVNPIPGLIRLTDKKIIECKTIIGEARVEMTNPVLQKIKWLPKIHKPVTEMRGIVSSVGSPTQNIAKW